MFLYKRLGGIVIASGLAVLLGGKVAEASQDLIWTPQSPQQRFPQFQRQQRRETPPLPETLTEFERQQTLQGLELIEVLGVPSLDRDRISAMRRELTDLAREQVPPYELSAVQTRELREIFASLNPTELNAINQILLTQTLDQPLTLTQTDRENLRQFFTMIPAENLSDVKRRQLRVLQEFLVQTSREETIVLSPEQTESFQSAIAFVFFTSPVGRTAQITELDPTKQATLSPTELDELIQGLQAIQLARLRPQQDERIFQLITELQQLQAQTSLAVTLSAKQTQVAREVMDSLTPQEKAAVDIIILSDRAPETITLTQTEIEDLLVFFQGIPPEDLSRRQQQQQQDLINFLTRLQQQPQTEVQLSSVQTEGFLQGTQRLVLGTSLNRATVATVSLSELQQILSYLGTAQQQVSLSPFQQRASNRLIGQLSLLEGTPDGQFIISGEQNQELITFLSSLSPSERREVEVSLLEDTTERVASPAISHSNPIGYGNSWGQIDVGVIFETPNRFGNTEDGSISASAGLGDPNKTIGFDTTLTFYSLTGENQSDPLETGSVSFEVSRNFSRNLGVSLGVENLIRFSPDNITPPQTNFYVVGTQRFQLRENAFSPFGLAYLTAGVGEGRFSPVDDFEFDENGAFNLFGSVAVQIVPRLNGITEWTGQDLNMGVSVVPFREVPLVINLMAVDIFGNVEEEFGQEGSARFSGSLNYGFFF